MIRQLTSSERTLLAIETDHLVTTAMDAENVRYFNLRMWVIGGRAYEARRRAYRRAFDHAYAKAEETRR